MTAKRRQRGLRITFDLVVAIPPSGLIVFDPLMDALRGKAKEVGLRPLDVDVRDFTDVIGRADTGWVDEDGRDRTPW